MVIEYIIDVILVAILVIGLTATIGVISNGIGEKFFGGKTKDVHFNQHANVQVGWKSVGGKKK